MNLIHIQELRNIDMWVKIGAIDIKKAKLMAQIHIDAINKSWNILALAKQFITININTIYIDENSAFWK